MKNPRKKSEYPRQNLPSRSPEYTRLESPEARFPLAWTWFFDDAIPAYVKRTYSPRESWKDKPFTKDDAIFFSKGIVELSDLFTSERPRSMPSYFNHPKYRSAYLLYFLPLQTAKFISAFQIQPEAVQATLEHGRKRGALRILDLGSGPGTASIAFLLQLLQMNELTAAQVPPIELEWFDANRDVLHDGAALAELLSSHFPKLRGKLKINTHQGDWWSAFSQFKAETREFSLILMGNVLNEASAPHLDFERLWSELLSMAKGGGLLALEPAARHSSQLLSKIRDRWIETGLIEPDAESIWGPCLHAQRCPLAEGRDWCHFSVPVQIPGRWFRGFSEAISTERQWAKYSYIWVASREARAQAQPADVRRVVSDPIGPGGSSAHSAGKRPGKAPVRQDVLLCEPEHPARLSISPRERLYRGDLVRLRKPN